MRTRSCALLLACLGLALVLGVVARSATMRVPLSFGAPISYEGGGFAVEIGDLNHDGRPDLISSSVGGFFVLLNHGRGRFGEPDYYETRAGYGIGQLADLDSNGSPDIVAVVCGCSRLGVFLNNGDGSFGASHEFETGLGPSEVSVTDLNDDGAPDVATANTGGNSASVLLNKGDGTFLPHVDLPTGKQPGSIAGRDLNGDGFADLVVANARSSTVSVLVNRGDGSFQPRNDYPAGGKPSTLSIADLGGDSKPDLVTSNADGTVSVLINLGNGSFPRKADYAAGRDPEAALGDLDGDGALDLAVADTRGSTISVLRNHGDGTFAPKVAYRIGPYPESLHIGDLNGGGKPDLVAVNVLSQANTASVLLNRGDGTFERNLYYATAYHSSSSGWDTFALALGDLNGDGRVDLAATKVYYPHPSEGVSVVLNTPGRCNVQRLVGLTLAAARQTLARVNCRLGKVRRAYSRVRKGRVAAQRPVVGQVRQGGAKVDVVVSRGSKR
jgi:FG-GAP-like repeat